MQRQKLYFLLLMAEMLGSAATAGPRVTGGGFSVSGSIAADTKASVVIDVSILIRVGISRN